MLLGTDMTDLIDQLVALLGENGVFHGKRLKERHFPSAFDFKVTDVEPLALVRPTSTEEVSAFMKICHAQGRAVVPHGGLTGLVDGTTSGKSEVAITLERMNKIEEIDAESRTMIVQAGAPLQQVQEQAENQGLFFPLDLGARGTATIGGNVSTNAGGNRVIRYGMMRDQILGMEIVLADGTIISSMNKVIKNNTGYDLKQLFVGAEGTLGIVTRLVLRLRPMPVSQDMALIGVNDFSQVTAFLNYIDSALGGTLSAFEVLWKDYYKLVTSPPAESAPPISHNYNYYILLEAMGGDPQSDADRFVEVLSKSLEDELIADAAVAQSQAERDAMWAIRDDVGQTGQNWPIFTYDISVSLNKMESYVKELRDDLNNQWADNTCMIFGHLGDGNLHVIVGVGDESAEARKAVSETVYRGLTSRGGSISAEHGIGLQKRNYLSWSRSEEEIALMSSIKKMLDPKNIMNPGKIFT